MSAWNGGNYYFEVFAHKYVNETGISKPSKGGTATGPPRPHSLDGTTSGGGLEESDLEVKGVGRSRSEGALATDHEIVEEIEYLEQRMTQWEGHELHGAGISGAVALSGVSGDMLSVSSHPADDPDVDQGVFVNGGMHKVSSFPVVSSHGDGAPPETPEPAKAAEDSTLRRRVGAE